MTIFDNSVKIKSKIINLKGLSLCLREIKAAFLIYGLTLPEYAVKHALNAYLFIKPWV